MADSGTRGDEMTKNFNRSYWTFIVLALLAEEDRWGYELSRIVKQRTNGLYELRHGVLYPLLSQLEKKKMLSSRIQKSPYGRFCKYFSLTQKGRILLQHERKTIEALMVFLKSTKP
jgi:PadR family transcriptional regulator, regulatory protein PadR